MSENSMINSLRNMLQQAKEEHQNTLLRATKDSSIENELTEMLLQSTQVKNSTPANKS